MATWQLHHSSYDDWFRDGRGQATTSLIAQLVKNLPAMQETLI